MPDPDVPMQVLGMHETLVAVLARERILLGVLADLVVLQMLLPVEALHALAALVQRVVDVLGLVLLQFVLAREVHVAVGAVEGPEIAVAGERVALEVERGLEGHAALGAGLVLGGVVEGGVPGEVLAGLERVAAEVAEKEAQVGGVVRG